MIICPFYKWILNDTILRRTAELHIETGTSLRLTLMTRVRVLEPQLPTHKARKTAQLNVLDYTVLKNICIPTATEALNEFWSDEHFPDLTRGGINYRAAREGPLTFYDTTLDTR
jgi:hypothetical protein